MEPIRVIPSYLYKSRSIIHRMVKKLRSVFRDHNYELKNSVSDRFNNRNELSGAYHFRRCRKVFQIAGDKKRIIIAQ